MALAILATGTCATAGETQSDSGRPAYTAADVHFMAGMIAHHAQAVLIAGWAPTHGAGPALRALCERIVVGQRDEIAAMQRWLRSAMSPSRTPTRPATRCRAWITPCSCRAC